jgi:hypothetical protein
MDGTANPDGIQAQIRSILMQAVGLILELAWVVALVPMLPMATALIIVRMDTIMLVLALLVLLLLLALIPNPRTQITVQCL